MNENQICGLEPLVGVKGHLRALTCHLFTLQTGAGLLRERRATLSDSEYRNPYRQRAGSQWSPWWLY